MTTQERTRQTEAVVGRHSPALVERDLERILAGYSEDACFLASIERARLWPEPASG